MSSFGAISPFFSSSDSALYFSFRSRFFQIRRFGAIFRSFAPFSAKDDKQGVHPLKAFFAAIGGCIGIGNVVGICTAVQIGGPGALFWAWIGGLSGMLIQYAEVYLGMKHRVKNEKGSYDGGPMYFLPIAYKRRWIAPLVCFFFAFYGVEIFMFNVMVDSISVNWHIDPYSRRLLLIATLVVARRRSTASEKSAAPSFPSSSSSISAWHFGSSSHSLSKISRKSSASIFEGAFTHRPPSAALPAAVALTISMGLSRGAYSGDIGVGYTSVIHAESSTTQFQTASLAHHRRHLSSIRSSSVRLSILRRPSHRPLAFGHRCRSHGAGSARPLLSPTCTIFMPFFLFLLGYTTILAYFVVGVKCAKFISPKWGPARLLSLCLHHASHSSPSSIPRTRFCSCRFPARRLLLLNLFGIFLLRKEVRFGLDE